MLIFLHYLMSLIVIRHSNREKIICSKVNGLTAGLTPEGIKNAKIFGKQLRDKLDVNLDNIYTTFMNRCIDTGDLINSEHNSQAIISNFDKEKSLIELGYVNQKYMSEYLDYFDNMIKKNDINYPLMFDVLSKKSIIEYKNCNEYGLKIISNFYIPTQSNLIVIHDVCVAPLMHFLSDVFKFHLENDMIEPKPLCGFQFSIQGKKTLLNWIDFDNGINVKKLILF